MKHITITSILALSIACPAFADITTSNNDPKCDNTTIGAYQGSTEMEAQWTANTINLKWYSENQEIDIEEDAPASCTYNSGITLPSAPSRPGYTFDKWVVRSAPVCPFGDIDISIKGTAAGWTKLNGNTGTNEAAYGLTRGSGEWASVFSYGIVKGVSSCNNISSSSIMNSAATYLYNNDAKPADAMNSNSTGPNCWCRITEIDGVTCPANSSFWVFYDLSNVGYGNTSGCADRCAQACSTLKTNVSFRGAMFGQALPRITSCRDIQTEKECNTSINVAPSYTSSYKVCTWNSSLSKCAFGTLDSCSAAARELCTDILNTKYSKYCVLSGTSCTNPY